MEIKNINSFRFRGMTTRLPPEAVLDEGNDRAVHPKLDGDGTVALRSKRTQQTTATLDPDSESVVVSSSDEARAVCPFP